MVEHAFILDRDLEVSLIKLIQSFTYDGLLEGAPGGLTNRLVLSQTEHSAKNDLHQDEIFLLLPGPADEELPAVTCIAQFKCRSVFKDQGKDFSSLGVIWFQDKLAFPIEASVLEQLKNVPFRVLCGEFEY